MTNKAIILSFRASTEELELINQAAKISGMRRSHFLRDTVLQAANDNSPVLASLRADIIRLTIDLGRSAGALNKLTFEPSPEACKEISQKLSKQLIRAEKLFKQCRELIRS